MAELAEEKLPTAEDVSLAAKAVKRRSLALRKIGLNGCVLLVVLWIDVVWMFGTFYDSVNHLNKMDVAIVDFDGGPIGTALLAAVSNLNGLTTSPNYLIMPANSTSPLDVQARVFRGDYWGAFYSTPNSSARFVEGLATSNSATLQYDPSMALEYVGLQVRYSNTWSAYVLPTLLQLEAVTIDIFTKETLVPSLLKNKIPLSTAQATLYLGSISAHFINLTPFSFGSRSLFNTLGTVLPILLQFFFILGMNGINTMTGQYQNTTAWKILRDRIRISIFWTLITSLSVCGWDLIYEETYTIGNTGYFFALWAVSWVSATTTFDWLDIVFTYTPLQFHPTAVVTWILLSVASTIGPIQIQASFYKIHYAFYPHAVFQIMITIFGRGAVNTLSYNLPILAIWMILGKVGVLFAMRRRAKQGLVPRL